MNKLKTSIIAGVTTIAIGGTLLAGSALAATNSNNPQDSLVDKIATKFNLNKDEVKQVFDEERQAHEAEHQQQIGEYLQSKVDDGTITGEQKTLLENKLKEMHDAREANRDSNSDLTHEERHQKMEESRTEFEQWAKDNNIPLDKLKEGILGQHRGPHGHGGMGMSDS